MVLQHVNDGDPWSDPDVKGGGGVWPPPAIDTLNRNQHDVLGLGNPAPYPGTAEYPRSGPQDVETVQFTDPTQPGNYSFQCDVHPSMNGHLVVDDATQ